MLDYIKYNNLVTLKTLDINRTPDNLIAVMSRLNDVYIMVADYINTDMKIIDLGTKDGLFFDLLTEKYEYNKENLTGLDCCPEVVEICQNKGYMVYEADIHNIPYTIKFDFIFIIHTLEHGTNPAQIVSECTRILNPDGYIFVEVPLQSQIDAPEKWGHYYPFSSYKEILELFKNYTMIKHGWQKTKSKSPWYRVLFQK